MVALCEHDDGGLLLVSGRTIIRVRPRQLIDLRDLMECWDDRIRLQHTWLDCEVEDEKLVVFPRRAVEARLRLADEDCARLSAWLAARDVRRVWPHMESDERISLERAEAEEDARMREERAQAIEACTRPSTLARALTRSRRLDG